ncbi:MAG: cell division protein ZapA [Clostridia bacterium]|nr:cell division protein ZapA [Clostridia bacterium]
MAKDKIKITVYGNNYYIFSDEDPKFIESLGEELDKKIKSILSASPRLSITQAAILASLDYLNDAKQVEDSLDNLREQIASYLEETQRYKMEMEVAKRDLSKVEKELKDIKKNNPSLNL